MQLGGIWVALSGTHWAAVTHKNPHTHTHMRAHPLAGDGSWKPDVTVGFIAS